MIIAFIVVVDHLHFYFIFVWNEMWVDIAPPHAKKKKKSSSSSFPSLFPSAFVRNKAYYWTNEVTIFFLIFFFYLRYYGYYFSLIIHLIVWSQQKGEEEECYKSLKRVIVWSRIQEDLSVYYFILLSNQVLSNIQLYACVIQIYISYLVYRSD